MPSYYQKYGGFLVTAAINKYMFINLNVPAIVNKIRIHYTKTETIDPQNIQDIEHEIVREALKYLNIRSPLEISSMADLSAGTGMGSSSSYTVGLLRALNAMMRRHIPVQELAEEACKIEIDLIGKPIGKQDQYAAAYGGVIVMEIDKSGKVTVTPLDIAHETIYELENRLMMFYTDIQRDANEILAEQSRKIDNESMLVGEGEGERGGLGDKERGRQGDKETGGQGEEETGRQGEEEKRSAVEAMHRIKEIGREVKTALEKGDVDRFGKLLNEHWLVKKSISTKMSNPDIDRWYATAMANGALGGKLMGAGGGGFLLLCVDNGKRKHLRSTMEAAGLRYMDFKFDWEGSKELVNI